MGLVWSVYRISTILICILVLYAVQFIGMCILDYILEFYI